MLVKADNHDEDIVAICPNGTQGESISVGDLLIALPAQPPKKKKIFGHGRQTHAAVAKALCQRSCLGLRVWMSGPRPPESFEKSFLRISRRSFDVGVKAFGSITNGAPYVYYG